MMAVPALELADTPLDVDVLQTLSTISSNSNRWPENDYSKGGLYDEDMLEGYNQRLEQGRIVTAVVTKMVYEASDEIIYGSHVPFGPDHIFPDLKLPWYSGIWGFLLGWYETWGVFCAALLGVYSSFCILRALFGLFMRILFLKDIKEPFRRILYRLICLQCFLEERFEQLNRRQQDIELQVLMQPADRSDEAARPNIQPGHQLVGPSLRVGPDGVSGVSSASVPLARQAPSVSRPYPAPNLDPLAKLDKLLIESERLNHRLGTLTKSKRTSTPNTPSSVRGITPTSAVIKPSDSSSAPVSASAPVVATPASTNSYIAVASAPASMMPVIHAEGVDPLNVQVQYHYAGGGEPYLPPGERSELPRFEHMGFGHFQD